MWLPKDERKLLAYYFSKIKQPNKDEEFKLPELAKYLEHGNVKELERNVKQPNEGAYDDKVVKEIDEYYVGEPNDKVRIANESLRHRGLINLKSHQHDDTTVFVSLSMDGCDLGRKYDSSFWIWSGLLFAEYRHHWIWVILSYIAGVGTMVLVNWLSKGD